MSVNCLYSLLLTCLPNHGDPPAVFVHDRPCDGRHDEHADPGAAQSDARREGPPLLEVEANG